MNWYKRSQLEPWQMTKRQYESISVPPLKERRLFNVSVGDRSVEVIQNPTGFEMRQMTKEVRDAFPYYPTGTPALRSTQDVNGNKYYWKANEGVHAYIEPSLSRMVGEDLNQNAQRESHERVVYQALKEGKPVPEEVFNEFKIKYPEIAGQYELV